MLIGQKLPNNSFLAGISNCLVNVDGKKGDMGTMWVWKLQSLFITYSLPRYIGTSEKHLRHTWATRLLLLDRR